MKTFKGTPSIPVNPESTIFMPGNVPADDYRPGPHRLKVPSATASRTSVTDISAESLC
jgi:hypothetical protein